MGRLYSSFIRGEWKRMISHLLSHAKNIFSAWQRERTDFYKYKFISIRRLWEVHHSFAQKIDRSPVYDMSFSTKNLARMTLVSRKMSKIMLWLLSPTETSDEIREPERVICTTNFDKTVLILSPPTVRKHFNTLQVFISLSLFFIIIKTGIRREKG